MLGEAQEVKKRLKVRNAGYTVPKHQTIWRLNAGEVTYPKICSFIKAFGVKEWIYTFVDVR